MDREPIWHVFSTQPEKTSHNVCPHLLVVGGSGQILLSLSRSPALGLLPLGGIAVSVVEGLQAKLQLYSRRPGTDARLSRIELLADGQIARREKGGQATKLQT